MKVMKDKEGLGGCHRAEGTEETLQLNVTWDPEVDLGTEKRHEWKN